MAKTWIILGSKIAALVLLLLIWSRPMDFDTMYWTTGMSIFFVSGLLGLYVLVPTAVTRTEPPQEHVVGTFTYDFESPDGEMYSMQLDADPSTFVDKNYIWLEVRSK